MTAKPNAPQDANAFRLADTYCVFCKSCNADLRRVSLAKHVCIITHMLASTHRRMLWLKPAGHKQRQLHSWRSRCNAV